MLIIALRTKRRWAVNVAHKGILSFHNIVMSPKGCSLMGELLELQAHLRSE